MAEVQAAAIERPLSPHLQIYRPLINMVMSILHRITGAALYFGTLLLAWLADRRGDGPGLLRLRQRRCSATRPGMLVLFGYTWALIHHMLGGIRHFIWDTGPRLRHLARSICCRGCTIVGSVALTAGAVGSGIVLERGGL